MTQNRPSSQVQNQSMLDILQQWDEQTQFSTTELRLLEDIESLFDQQQQQQDQNKMDQTQQHHDNHPPILSEQDFYQQVYQHSSSIESDGKQPFNNEFYGLSDQKKKYIDQLIQYKSICTDLTHQIEQTVHTCDELRSEYRSVCQKTGTLHEDCERLLGEKEELSMITSGIKEALDHFDDMKEFSAELDAGKPTINIDLFSISLKQLDDSLDFLMKNREYREAKQYIARYRMLQSRALAQLRDQVLTILRSVTDNILSKITKDMTDLSPLLYIQFRAAIEFLQPMIHEIELRSNKSEYSVFIMDCFDCYVQQRNALIYRTVQAKVQSLSQTQDLKAYVRDGCGYMLRICSEEDELFKHFFSCDMVLPGYRSFISSFCDLVYEGLRSMLIHENKIGVLCDVIDILRTEVLGDGTMPRGASTSSFEPIVHHMIQDVQERLIYRSSTYISDILRSYKPTMEEINYPEILINHQQNQADKDDTQSPSIESNQLYHISLSGPHLDILQMGTLLLDRLHQSVDVGIFEGFAHEVISICTNSFIEASRKISEKKTVMDGELFFIRHLFALHEHILVFKINSINVETELDFSQLRDGMLRFLKGQATFRVKNIIFDIMSQTRPRIVHSSVDAKKDLEKLLESACEELILNVTRQAFDPCMSYLKRLTTLANEQKSQKTENTVAPIIDSAEVLTMYEQITRSLPETLDQLVSKLPLYLPKLNHQRDLFNAIKQSITRVYDQLLKQIEKRSSPSIKEELFSSMWEPKDLAHVFQQAELKLQPKV